MHFRKMALSKDRDLRSATSIARPLPRARPNRCDSLCRATAGAAGYHTAVMIRVHRSCENDRLRQARAARKSCVAEPRWPHWMLTSPKAFTWSVRTRRSEASERTSGSTGVAGTTNPHTRPDIDPGRLPLTVKAACRFHHRCRSIAAPHAWLQPCLQDSAPIPRHLPGLQGKSESNPFSSAGHGIGWDFAVGQSGTLRQES